MRLARIFTSPLIPFVLLAKIFGRVIASRRYFWQLLFALPMLFVFIVAWAMGELAGYCGVGFVFIYDRDHRAEASKTSFHRQQDGS